MNAIAHGRARPFATTSVRIAPLLVCACAVGNSQANASKNSEAADIQYWLSIKNAKTILMWRMRIPF
jgi:hypothetical protein